MGDPERVIPPNSVAVIPSEIFLEQGVVLKHSLVWYSFHMAKVAMARPGHKGAQRSKRTDYLPKTLWLTVPKLAHMAGEQTIQSLIQSRRPLISLFEHALSIG